MPDKQMTAYTADQLFVEWSSHGLVDQAELPQLEAYITSRGRETELSLYLRILAGIGAFIAAAFFIAFLLVSELIQLEVSANLTVWGVLFILGGFPFALIPQPSKGGITHSFLLQISFCLMATGKILFVIGFAGVFRPHEAWGASLGALLVAGATYPLYRMSADRFLSVLAVLVLVFVGLLNNSPLQGGEMALLSAFFIVQLALAAVLMTDGRIGRDVMPIAYALIASLCIEALFFASQSTAGAWQQRFDLDPTAMTIAVAVALIALIGWAAGGVKQLASQPLILASLGVAALAIVSTTPGILLSIGLMIFGYARHDRLVLLLGGLLFPTFLSLYYYNLHLTLMAKSGILVAGGAVLLAGWAYTHFRGFDREV